MQNVPYLITIDVSRMGTECLAYLAYPGEIRDAFRDVAAVNTVILRSGWVDTEVGQFCYIVADHEELITEFLREVGWQ